MSLNKIKKELKDVRIKWDGGEYNILSSSNQIPKQNKNQNGRWQVLCYNPCNYFTPSLFHSSYAFWIHYHTLKSFSNILCPVLPSASWQETNIFCTLLGWLRKWQVCLDYNSFIIFGDHELIIPSWVFLFFFLQKLNAALKLSLIKEPNEHSSIWKFNFLKDIRIKLELLGPQLAQLGSFI